MTVGFPTLGNEIRAPSPVEQTRKSFDYRYYLQRPLILKRFLRTATVPIADCHNGMAYPAA
jgi:hypothetical protein